MRGDGLNRRAVVSSNLEALPNNLGRPPTAPSGRVQRTGHRFFADFRKTASATFQPSHEVLQRNHIVHTTMADSNAAAPAQYKQPSRKGKKAWRKNVDVTQIQSGLEDVREQIIQGYV